MDAQDRLTRLIRQLYLAPGGTEEWIRFLGQLSGDVRATGAAFVSYDLARTAGSVAAIAGFDPGAMPAYEAHWSEHDPWARNDVFPTLRTGDVVRGEQLMPQEKVVRTAYYNDFGRRFGIARCLTGMIEVEPHVFSCLTINAPEVRGPFDDIDARLLQTLMPHLQRALQLHRQLAANESASRDWQNALDGGGQALFLLDDRGRVTFMNGRAAQLSGAGDGIVCSGGEIGASHPDDTTRLRAALASALDIARGTGVGAGAIVRLRRREGRPLVALVAPRLPDRERSNADPGEGALVIVTDPDARTRLSVDLLQELYALTVAEIRLVEGLAGGKSLDEIAGDHRIRSATIRGQLKTVFEKTGQHTQADLVRLLLSLSE